MKILLRTFPEPKAERKPVLVPENPPRATNVVGGGCVAIPSTTRCLLHPPSIAIVVLGRACSAVVVRCASLSGLC